MKKIAVSLIALAAISSAALASGNRSWELRDADTYVGKYSSNAVVGSTSTNAFAVAGKGQVSSNFERLNMISAANDQNGRH